MATGDVFKGVNNLGRDIDEAHRGAGISRQQ